MDGDHAGGGPDTFDFTAQQAAVDVGAEHVISVAELRLPSGGASFRAVLGKLVEGMAFDDFLTPPAGPTSARIGDPIHVPPIATATSLAINVGDGRETLWTVRSPLGFPTPSALTIPVLPVEAAALLPAQLTGTVIAASSPLFLEHPDGTSRSSSSAPFTITR